ncbi:hypothetical protein [Thomasclavelia spiroformis]|uniref:hypothetical protein n=1 Tax=Thomasclavelia spiroformis TaxID=29348 RepID=UPI0026743FD1|nr:hypothetical protein [Thomasclavelia spiroformis]
MYYDWPGSNAYLDKSNSKLQICPKCGCTMSVTVMVQDGHNEIEDYCCPNNSCDEVFSVRACNTPKVKLVKLK